MNPLNEYTDKDLWKAFIGGNKAAYEELYNRYVDILFQYGIQFSTDNELIKDAIQDVYIHLYTHRNRIKTDVQPKFYLFSCLKHRLFDILKREAIFEPIDNDVFSEDIRYALSDITDKQIILKEESLAVHSMLEVLTPKQREAIYYRYVQDMDLKEIAELLPMKYQSVQNLLQRALKKLRDIPCLFLFW